MNIDASQLLINLSSSYPAIFKLVTALCVASGFGFALRGIYALKIYGETRTMMNPHTSLRPPLVYLFVAMALIYFPEGFKMVMQTIYGNSRIENILTYDSGQSVHVTQAIRAVLGLVQIIGIIAFLKGWHHLSKHANHHGGGGQSGIGKAITHIIGGILAINIIGTYKVINATFGLPPLNF